jgi:hypothetical protein
MKKIIALTSLLATSAAYAQKVTGVGMQGYFVYQDSNGNKYVTHPTVPGVAYDLSGKKLDTVPNGIKYATVQKDGTIMPFGEHDSTPFSTMAWIVGVVLIVGMVWAFFKNKRQAILAQQELQSMARMRENVATEAGNIFNKFYKNFHPSQIEYFEENTNGELLSSIRTTIMQESDYKEVEITSLKVEVQNVYRENNKPTASVRFNAIRKETVDGKTKEIQSNEIWILQLADNKWVVSQIKEMAPTVVRNVQVIEQPKFKEKEIEIGSTKDTLGL